MRRDMNREEQIAGGRLFSFARSALTAEANLSAICDASGDFYLDPVDFAIRVLDSDFRLAALNSGLERNLNFALNVRATIFGTATAAFAAGLRGAAEAAEELGKRTAPAAFAKSCTFAKELAEIDFFEARRSLSVPGLSPRSAAGSGRFERAAIAVVEFALAGVVQYVVG